MNTQLLNEKNIQQAAAILRDGGLVGIPTETVYGLGANGLNPQAVARIFQAKGRPQDNPLILHIPSIDHLDRYCKGIPLTAYRLAERFWPGPLTMILARRDVVPDVVTAGLDTRWECVAPLTLYAGLSSEMRMSPWPHPQGIPLGGPVPPPPPICGRIWMERLMPL